MLQFFFLVLSIKNLNYLLNELYTSHLIFSKCIIQLYLLPTLLADLNSMGCNQALFLSPSEKETLSSSSDYCQESDIELSFEIFIVFEACAITQHPKRSHSKFCILQQRISMPASLSICSYNSIPTARKDCLLITICSLV